MADGLDCGGQWLDLSRPAVVGVVNITPDSFSDGGTVTGAASAVAQARRMVEEGAAMVDVGGESSRPGAAPVDEKEELRRILPVVEALAEALPVPISVDTCKPGVMRAAVAVGAGMINDIRALNAPGALEAAADAGVPVCLMHMQGEPRTMQDAPRYGDVVGEVRDFLAGRIEAAAGAGIPQDRLVVDPGFGFGKSLRNNYELLGRLDALVELGVPVLVGMSRKSMIGNLLERPLDQRLVGGAAAAALAVFQGARLVRTHDVAATADAVRVAQAARRPDGIE